MEEQLQLLLTDYQRNLFVLLTCCQIRFRPPDHYRDWLLTEKNEHEFDMKLLFFLRLQIITKGMCNPGLCLFIVTNWNLVRFIE
jgi:hypothetical protein